MADCCDAFKMVDEGDSFQSWNGLRGPYYTPHLSADGVLSWTNTGSLPNPTPVDIKGNDGKSAYQAAVEAGFTGTEAEFSEYLSGIGDLTQEVADQKSAIEALEDLTNRKAGMLVDTAFGAIASFEPDSTIPDLLGVSVAVEPVQDLHGQDSPWPAGGGVNKFNGAAVTTTHTSNWGIDWNSDTYVLAITRKTSYTTGTPTFSLNLPSGTYVASYQSVSETGQISFYTDGSWVKSLNNAVTFEIDSTKTNEIRFAAVTVTKFQIQSGSTATAYAPYSNICPISGWDAVEVEADGINVWDEEWEVGDISADTGQNVSASTLIRSKNYIPVKAGQQYYFHINSQGTGVRARWYGKDKTYLGYAPSIPYNGVFTVPDNAYFLRFTPQVSYGATYNNDISINYPSTDHAYHPYAGNRYTIALGQTVYGGTLDATAGTLTVDRAMLTLDGTQTELASANWRPQANSVGFYYNFTGLNIKDPPTISTATEAIADSSKAVSYDVIYSNDICSFAVIHTGGFQRICVRITDTTLTTIAAVNAYLAQNPITICYPLATPITITLDPVTISTIANQLNNVWADAGDVSVEFAADLKTYIDQKIAAAVAALS